MTIFTPNSVVSATTSSSAGTTTGQEQLASKAPPTSSWSPSSDSQQQQQQLRIAIAGGGIAGLTLALCLLQHCGVTADVYEQATQFADDVGAGMSLYANSLRILLDELGLGEALAPVTHPFGCRKWTRHDGTTVAEAPEMAMVHPDNNNNNNGDPVKSDANTSESANKLQSMGIRRWRLQKVLFDAAQQRGIPIHFGKGTQRLERLQHDDPNKVRLIFQDGTTATADLVLACDGCRSVIRTQVTSNQHELRYTGTTCLMGIAQHPCQGICLPTSFSDNTHGVFFPTGVNEQCFQFHFDVPTEQADPSNWGTLSQAVTERECAALVQRLRNEGWSEKEYLEPFRHVVSALRIGLCLLEPALDHFVHWDNTVVLLGDAAHPPVPYLGQAGAMGVEDASVLSLLLRHYCCNDGHSIGLVEPQNLPMVLQLYEQMRVPRTRAMLANSRQMGRAQTLRASPVGNRRAAREEMIQRQVFFHETLPLLFPGANYDVRREVEAVIAKARLPVVAEEDEDEEVGRGQDDRNAQSRSTENPVLWVSCARGQTVDDNAPVVQTRECAHLATSCD